MNSVQQKHIGYLTCLFLFTTIATGLAMERKLEEQEIVVEEKPLSKKDRIRVKLIYKELISLCQDFEKVKKPNKNQREEFIERTTLLSKTIHSLSEKYPEILAVCEYPLTMIKKSLPQESSLNSNQISNENQSPSVRQLPASLNIPNILEKLEKLKPTLDVLLEDNTPKDTSNSKGAIPNKKTAISPCCKEMFAWASLIGAVTCGLLYISNEILKTTYCKK